MKKDEKEGTYKEVKEKYNDLEKGASYLGFLIKKKRGS